MHARRQLPHRLSLGAVLVLSACASSRYVGTIGPSGVYSNLGYGVAIDLSAGELLARWQVIDPEDPSGAPPADRPAIFDAPLDLDGDGELTSAETIRHLRPTLRLLARSSSAAGARIDVDVVILGGAAATRTIDALAGDAAREVLGPEQVAPDWKKGQLPGGYTAWTTELGSQRLIVIDQPELVGERSGKPRHQQLRVVLSAPTLDDALRADQDRLVRALSLSDTGGPVSRQDRW